MINNFILPRFFFNLIAAVLCLFSSNLYASWNDYINFLKSDNMVSQGAIFSNDDGKVLAASPGLTLSTHVVEIPTDDGVGTRKVKVNETALLLELFKNHGQIKSTPAGLWIGGVKYYVVNFDAESETAYLKKQNGGACLVKTNKTIVFGSFDTSQRIQSKNSLQNPGDTNKKVEELAKLLKDAGY